MDAGDGVEESAAGAGVVTPGVGSAVDAGLGEDVVSGIGADVVADIDAAGIAADSSGTDALVPVSGLPEEGNDERLGVVIAASGLLGAAELAGLEGVVAASGAAGNAEFEVLAGVDIAEEPLSKSSPPAVVPPAAGVAIGGMGAPLLVVPSAGPGVDSGGITEFDELGDAALGAPFPKAFMRSRVFSASPFLFCFL